MAVGMLALLGALIEWHAEYRRHLPGRRDRT